MKRISALIGLLLLVHSSSITPSSANKSKTTQKPTSNVARGKALFLANGCMDCHSINGQGCTEGVSLSSVGLRRDADFLKQQLIDPDKHVEKNKKAFNSEPNLMTNPDLSPKEVDLIVTYLQTLKKPVPKKGEKSKDYNSL
ncbi:MAG TPA: cytochrome c [Drouetiella sp.]